MSDVAREYEAQRELFIRGALAQRSTVVNALLAGEGVDVELAERTLSYRLDGSHVAVVVWSALGAAQEEGLLAAARELGRAVGEGRQLLLSDTPGEVTLWTRPAHEAGGRLDGEGRLGGELKAVVPAGVRAAIGMRGKGVEGFRSSKRQADLARWVAEEEASDAVVLYGDVALAAVMLRDREAGRAFAREQLGELAGGGPALAELRRTLSAFYSCGQDGTRTARRLGVHRNTVARRVQRIEGLLGHGLQERARELQAALAVAEVTGGG